MKKLTVQVDAEVIEMAKQLARESGTSVSSVVARLVRLAARRPTRQKVGKQTRRASGVAVLPPGKTEDDILAEALIEKHGARK